jgi:exodeoxyribonuclease VII large subunit
MSEVSQGSLFGAGGLASERVEQPLDAAEPPRQDLPDRELPAGAFEPDGRGGEIVAPGRSAETALSVSDVNAAVREVLESSFAPLWVVGEVANWRRASSGHCYFSLRDESAQISCVIWRSDATRLPTDPEEGMELCAYGSLSLYETRGQYQLVVQKLEAKGEGLWRLAFERTRRRLEAEGLTDPARRRRLPALPRRVGIVTSREGAAFHDVVSVIRRRAPWTHILLSACRVQGEGAVQEICAALDAVCRHPEVDVVVLTRGGGSVEDLWCFNEEVVARAVAGCPVPIVTAVGHEVDVTIVDLVADLRAPTPSVAGELVVPDAADLRVAVQRGSAALAAALRSRARRAEERASRASERMGDGVIRFVERCGSWLDRLGGRLEALSPLSTLERGYAVPMDAEGSVLRRLEMFEPGDAFRLRVVDGEVAARVEATGGTAAGAEHGGESST